MHVVSLVKAAFGSDVVNYKPKAEGLRLQCKEIGHLPTNQEDIALAAVLLKERKSQTLTQYISGAESHHVSHCAPLFLASRVEDVQQQRLRATMSRLGGGARQLGRISERNGDLHNGSAIVGDEVSGCKAHCHLERAE